VVVVGVREVEMYSDVNLHLKRQNVVTHLGGDLSFLGILAMSASLWEMKAEMEGGTLV
jgi:hypothetical protein